VRIACLSGLAPDAAQDCAQETFVHAFERRAQLRDPQAFPLWFHRILTRRILDALGASDRRHEEPLAEAEQLAEDWQRREPAQPDTLAVAAEQRAELWRYVQTLPPSYRVPLVLRYYGDFSIREVAELVGAREGTVRVTLHRALGLLRARLTPQPPIEHADDLDRLAEAPHASPRDRR
jgi:RNA polymerase sigma-70 factor (ECF subfamily)